MQVTGFDIPHSFPEDYVPVFGMDVPTCVSFYNKRHSQCVPSPPLTHTPTCCLPSTRPTPTSYDAHLLSPTAVSAL